LKIKKKVILGIIGAAGRIGDLHTRNVIFNFPHIKLKAICDIKTDSLKQDIYGLKPENIVSDYKVIIDDDEINTVLICTPTPTHVDMIIEFANARKNIFCEKPIDLNPLRAKKALGAVKKSGIKLQIGFMRRFDSDHMKLREMILQGILGRQYVIRTISRDAEAPPFEYIKNSGGIFQDNTCHDFDAVRYLTGSEIEEVYAMGAVLIKDYFKEVKDFDTVIVNLKFENGAMGIIENNYQTSYGCDQRVEVFGSKGSAIINNYSPNQVSLSSDKGIIRDKLLLSDSIRYQNAYIEELSQFFTAIQNDTETPVTGLDGLINILIGIAAKESVENNKPIKVDYSLCK